MDRTHGHGKDDKETAKQGQGDTYRADKDIFPGCLQGLFGTMNKNKRCTHQGSCLDCHPEHNYMIGNGDHGHGREEEQHGSVKYRLLTHLHLTHIDNGIQGDNEKKKGEDGKDQHPFRGVGEIFGLKGTGYLEPLQSGKRCMNDRGGDQEHSSFLGREKINRNSCNQGNDKRKL